LPFLFQLAHLLHNAQLHLLHLAEPHGSEELELVDDEGPHPFRHVAQELLGRLRVGCLEGDYQILLIRFAHQQLELAVGELADVVEDEHQVADRLGHFRGLRIHGVEDVLLDG